MENTPYGSRARPDWLARAIQSGFIASIAMLFTFGIAYGFAFLVAGVQLADKRGAATFRDWFHALTDNAMIDLARPNLYAAIAVYLAVGLVWAGVYAYVFEPRLTGPAWRRGLVFSLLPWALSLAVFLPVVGGGFLGLGVGAGPLPMIGNFVLHVVYGVALGVVYGPFGDRVTDGTFALPTGNDVRVMQRAERMAAKGVVAGLILGIAIGVVGSMMAQIGAEARSLGVDPLAFTVATALFGASFGGLIGSLIGLPSPEQMSWRQR